jgi:hypothetical protein
MKIYDGFNGLYIADNRTLYDLDPVYEDENDINEDYLFAFAVNNPKIISLIANEDFYVFNEDGFLNHIKYYDSLKEKYSKLIQQCKIYNELL